MHSQRFLRMATDEGQGGGDTAPLSAAPLSAVPLSGMPATAIEVARYIDHTQLSPQAGNQHFAQLCDEALQWHTATVCVPSSWVSYCAERLAGSSVGVCSVVGFPHGNALPRAKGVEAEKAIEAGASEIDTVVNQGWLLEGRFPAVLEELRLIADICHGHPRGRAKLKVILETTALREHAGEGADDLIKRACELCTEAEVDFVKTGTGFYVRKDKTIGIATLEDVRLLRACSGPKVEVKAAGGIGNVPTAQAMIKAGATRLGCSRTVAILTGLAAEGGY